MLEMGDGCSLMSQGGSYRLSGPAERDSDVEARSAELPIESLMAI
jgi:hypothetical protein